MKRKYKIKCNSLGNYDVLYSYNFLPFWIKSNSWTNTFHTVDDAKDYILKLKNPTYL